MARTDNVLAQKFHCPKCHGQGAHVERLAMSGTGLSRLMEIQQHRYAFVSCNNCGYTEVFNLRTLEGRDNLGTFLEILFHD
jgi:predicted nucleic-acid-binding Zn-ribbon protein